MKRLVYILISILFGVLSAIALGEFYLTQKIGDPEYYILLFCIICGSASVGSLWFLSQNIYYNKNQKILENDKTKPNMSPKVAEEIAKKIIEDAKMHRKSRGEDKD